MLAREEDARSRDGILALAAPRKEVVLAGFISNFFHTEVDLLGGIADHAGNVHLAAVLLDQREPVVSSVGGSLADDGSLGLLQRFRETRVAVSKGDFRPEIFDAFELGVTGRSDTDSGLVWSFVVCKRLREVRSGPGVWSAYLLSLKGVSECEGG